MNLILIGIQGSGKGTQAALLTEKYGWEQITTGGLFRENMANKTELGMIAKDYMEKGELVPDKYVYAIVEDALNKKNGKFILDGFPRNIKQAEFLLERFTIDKVVQLDLSDEKALERTTSRRICVDCKQDYNVLYKKPKQEGICDKCGGKVVTRDDDKPEAIKIRIEKFHNETNEVIELFAEEGLLVKVDASQKPNEIFEEIKKKINQ